MILLDITYVNLHSSMDRLETIDNLEESVNTPYNLHSSMDRLETYKKYL